MGESFSPDLCWAPTIDCILEEMISQGNKKEEAHITSDDIVLYYNGIFPMMKNVPIIAYSLTYGVDTAKELAKPIVVSFSIIGKSKVRRCIQPFLVAYNHAEPVLLKDGDLGSDVRQKAMDEVLSQPGPNPMQDKRYVYLGRLFNDLLAIKLKKDYTINVWL